MKETSWERKKYIISLIKKKSFLFLEQDSFMFNMATCNLWESTNHTVDCVILKYPHSSTFIFFFPLVLYILALMYALNFSCSSPATWLYLLCRKTVFPALIFGVIFSVGFYL